MRCSTRRGAFNKRSETNKLSLGFAAFTKALAD